jgi:hypothetical protein
MSNNTRAALETAATDESIDLDERDVRALTQYLTVLDDYDRARGADDLYMVVSQSGDEYLVDARAGRCECPDHEYRGVRCKHLRRVAFATGERPIPAGVDLDAVDDQLGRHVTANPRRVATDGGDVRTGDGGDVRTGDGGAVTAPDADTNATDDRPDDCQCAEFLAGNDLPCWPCYREGFETPNAAALEGAD